MNKKCLVIGGGGFLGYHLVPRLIESGREVTVLDRSPIGKSSLPAETRFVRGNFADQALVKSLIDEHSEIIHLAYATVPTTSFADPLGDLLENLPPMVRLFSGIAAKGSRLLLVSSGGTVYGQSLHSPIREEHPTDPISPYGVTKLTLEKYAHMYAVTHGLEVVCVRPSNPYGEAQRPFAGQGFVANAMASGIQGKPVEIFGDHGTIRDYIYAGDVAYGIVSALAFGRADQCYNIGSGHGLSNREMLEHIDEALARIGCKVNVEYRPARIFDVQSNILNSEKLARDTGWEPQTEPGQGLQLTLGWLQDYLGNSGQ